MSARSTRYVVPLVACLVLFRAEFAEAADACSVVADALIKLAQTPNHSFTESRGAIAGGKSRANERIATATAAYIQVRGKWLKSIMTPQQEVEMQRDAMKDGKNRRCQYLHDEPVDGEPAALYVTHDDGDGGKSDTRIWISKKRGLPLRQVVHLSVGGKLGESEMTTRYVYENVAAPAGAG